MTIPETLRAAADKAERLADAATPGPWVHLDCEGESEVWRREATVLQRNGLRRSPASHAPEDLVVTRDLDTWDRGEDEQDDQIRASHDHIAAWHPEVARVVAAMWRHWADWAEERRGFHDDGDEIYLSTDFELVEPALAAARAFLGEEATS